MLCLGTGRDHGYAGVRRSPEHFTFTFTLRRNAAKVAAALDASVAALAAGTLGSHQGASDIPGAGGGASPSALAPRTLPGAGSCADLMDADDAAAEKASGGFRPPITGALGAPVAGGGASPSAWSAPRIVNGRQRAAGGADGGALGSPGAGRDASPSARSPLCTAAGSRRAAGDAAGGALGASGAAGAASPSAQSAPRTVLGSHQAAGGAACGALGAASPSNLTPCSGPSFPPAPRLGAIHESKCGLPPDPPLTLQVTPSSGASAGGARFKGSGGNSEAAPVPPWSGTGGSTSSDVQTTRSGGSDSTSSDVQATRSSGSGNTGSEVPTARSVGSGNTGRDVQTTRTGGSGSTNSDVPTTRSDSCCSTSGGVQTTRSGGSSSASRDVQARSGEASATSNGIQTVGSGGSGGTHHTAQATTPGGQGSTEQDVSLGGEGMQKAAHPTHQFGVLQDEEGCTRRCIQELHTAVLELLLHGFWEQGLHCTAPPSAIRLCANPPPGRLPCAAPWGIAPVCHREGWGSTPPLHCPDDCTLPHRPQGNRRGVVTTALPLQPPVLPMLQGVAGALRADLAARPTSAALNGGALPEDGGLVLKRPSGQPPCPSPNLTQGQGRAEC